jgi:hypothetical protein
MSEMTHRTAQPGDIFLLLVPSAQELHQLRQWQYKFRERYGGQPVEFIHITCQRFSPGPYSLEVPCIEQLKNDIQNSQPFKINTDRLIQFYAPYWQRYVLRWRVQETISYSQFRDRLNTILIKTGCLSHFDRHRHATCPILNLGGKIDLEFNPPKTTFPTELFTAKHLWVSKLQNDNRFEILEEITLQDQ